MRLCLITSFNLLSSQISKIEPKAFDEVIDELLQLHVKGKEVDVRDPSYQVVVDNSTHWGTRNDRAWETKFYWRVIHKIVTEEGITRVTTICRTIALKTLKLLKNSKSPSEAKSVLPLKIGGTSVIELKKFHCDFGRLNLRSECPFDKGYKPDNMTHEW